MDHLSDEEILELARLTDETIPYDSGQLAEMDHIAVCGECANRFYAALALATALGESRYIEPDGDPDEDKPGKDPTITSASLALLWVACIRAGNKTTVEIKQDKNDDDALHFVCPMRSAARGGDKNGSSIARAEDTSDDKTFVQFDPVKNELSIIIGPDNIPEGGLKAVIINEGKRMDGIPFIREGNNMTCRIKDLPSSGFGISIEKS